MASKIQFKLGGIALDKFEVPEKFDIGHELAMAEHKLITESGKPVIKVHTMGAFPLPTQWEGMLYYSTALRRAAELDRLMTSQQVIPWVYGPLQYNVIIKSFKATPTGSQFEVKYAIELVVLESLNGTTYGVDNTVPYDVGTQTFYANAQQAVTSLKTLDPALPASLTDATAGVDSVIAANWPLSAQPFAVVYKITQAVEAAINELQAYVSPLESTAVLAADLAKLSASLAALQGFGLMNQNLLQLLGQGPYTQTVNSFVGNLFDLAGQYYPNADPTDAAPLIATANGLLDFFVTEPMDIQLPPMFN